MTQAFDKIKRFLLLLPAMMLLTVFFYYNEDQPLIIDSHPVYLDEDFTASDMAKIHDRINHDSIQLPLTSQLCAGREPVYGPSIKCTTSLSDTLDFLFLVDGFHGRQISAFEQADFTDADILFEKVNSIITQAAARCRVPKPEHFTGCGGIERLQEKVWRLHEAKTLRGVHGDFAEKQMKDKKAAEEALTWIKRQLWSFPKLCIKLAGLLGYFYLVHRVEKYLEDVGYLQRKESGEFWDRKEKKEDV